MGRSIGYNATPRPRLSSPPVWEYTGYYQTTATYREFTSQPIGIGMGGAVQLKLSHRRLRPVVDWQLQTSPCPHEKSINVLL